MENLGLGILTMCGIIFLIVGAILYFFPPKKINSFYGYRTMSSMSSDERWKFAQKYSALRVIEAGIFVLLCSALIPMIDLSEKMQTGINIGAIVISVVYMLARTEIALKKKFPTI